MYAEVHDADRAAEAVNATATPDLPALRTAVEKYDRLVRQKAIPEVRGFYEAIVEASNARHEEGRKELARSKHKAALAARTALVLYLVGSFLALGGQYLDKVYKKRIEAKANTSGKAT